MPNAKRMVDGKCGACRGYNHCGTCVCCGGIASAGHTGDGMATLLPTAGRTRTFAYVVTRAGDAHGAHYVRLRNTHRIPDGGKVRLQWRDNLASVVAPVARVSNNPRVQRFVAERLERAHMQSRCRG